MIALKYPTNTEIQLQNSKTPFALHFLKLLHKKKAQMRQTRGVTTNHRMFGATNLHQPRDFTQSLFVIFVTFSLQAGSWTQVWERDGFRRGV